MKILSVNDVAFTKYGRIVRHINFMELAEALKDIPVTDDVVYEPSVQSLESLSISEQLSNIFFGEMPIQIGYCNGHNHLLNAVEYHRSSEINLAVTDAILLVGMQQDVREDFTYETARMEAFFIPAGVAVELYATTLHYAPCGVNGAGFQVAVVLPKGTNYPLTSEHGKKENCKLDEDDLLAATNKWLIGHKDGGMESNVFIGLKGENLNIKDDIIMREKMWNIEEMRG